jgi:hypothetical protein
MKKYLTILVTIIFACNPESQHITGEQLLNLTLAYHDPENHWGKLKSTVYYDEYRADSSVRKSVVHFDNIAGNFKMERSDNLLVITRGTVGDSCYVLVNGSANFNAELDSTFNLACDRSFLYRDYYLYMQGLPMKLKDPGAMVAHEVQKTTFMEKEYFKMKATYTEDVGSDIWYFYVNPETYAVEAYQFYHDEDKQDGEYILLEGTVETNGMIWPEQRIWYTNKGNQYLGKDVIVEIIDH